MKAKEFKRLFKDPDNDDLTAKYGSLLRRTDHQGHLSFMPPSAFLWETSKEFGRGDGKQII